MGSYKQPLAKATSVVASSGWVVMALPPSTLFPFLAHPAQHGGLWTGRAVAGAALAAHSEPE